MLTVGLAGFSATTAMIWVAMVMTSLQVAAAARELELELARLSI